MPAATTPAAAPAPAGIDSRRWVQFAFEVVPMKALREFATFVTLDDKVKVTVLVAIEGDRCISARNHRVVYSEDVRSGRQTENMFRTRKA